MNKDKKNTKIQQRRKVLSELSREAEDIRKGKINNAETIHEELFWSTRTINYILLNMIYDTDGATEFKTFAAWKKEGATVKKGSKAFVIWGQPLDARSRKQEEAKPKTSKEETPEDEYEFFPLCFLFSDRQVIRPEDRKTKNEETRQDQSQEQNPESPESWTEDQIKEFEEALA